MLLVLSFYFNLIKIVIYTNKGSEKVCIDMQVVVKG